jgi:hypothetical protein
MIFPMAVPNMIAPCTVCAAASARAAQAIKLALENWSWYLLGSEFKVVLYSDHQALQALDKSSSLLYVPDRHIYLLD